MNSTDIIKAAANYYYTHKELSLVEAVATKERHLSWIASAQKELTKILGV